MPQRVMNKKFLQFVSTRTINDVDKKLPLPNPEAFILLCQMFYDKAINNIQFKKSVKILQNE